VTGPPAPPSTQGIASISDDAAGNTVGDGSTTYGCSDRGRVASATTATGTANYLYNGYVVQGEKP
jgi:hypothetical protein